MKYNIAKKLISFLFISISISSFFIQTNTTKAQSEAYTLTSSIDKETVKPGETFSVTFTATNTGTKNITNFEIRVPFARSIAEANYTIEDPSFNKVLDSIEFPAGYNSRSWIINTFKEGDVKTFKISYTVAENAKNTNGLLSKVNLPIVWVDPAGLESNKALEFKNLRADIYINKSYKSSTQVPLPTLQSIEAPVSSVNLNAKYLFQGSKTTNLKNINQTNFKSVPNFSLESQDVLLEWQKPIDLSATNAATLLSSLDSNLDTSWGKIVYKDNIPFLSNIPVKITFKNTNFVFDPKVKTSTDVVDLTTLKGTNNKSSKTVTLNLDKLSTVILLSDIQSEKAVYDIDKQDNEIKIKVSDPRSTVTYSLNGQETNVSSIDLVTGEFTIPVKISEGSVQITISAKLKNNEVNSKVIVVRFSNDATPTPTEELVSSSVSMPFNQLTIILLLAALGILSIIGGIVFYILRNRKAQQLKKAGINIKPITINKVSSITPTAESNLFPTAKLKVKAKEIDNDQIDLVSLRSKYMNDKTSETMIKSND